jgi:antitoxin (DNA-binding transcriptional repressor) of toxin-antitoxin stability system
MAPKQKPPYKPSLDNLRPHEQRPWGREPEGLGGLEDDHQVERARVLHGQLPQIDKVASRSYHVVMRAVGLKVLKNKLSEYVRLAANGETVLVTDRDRVVAELGPPQEGRSPVLADARLAEAVRRGWIPPPALPGTDPPPRQPVTTLRQLLRELAQDRADR